MCTFKLDYRRRGQNRGAVECSRDVISRLPIHQKRREISRLYTRREGRLEESGDGRKYSGERAEKEGSIAETRAEKEGSIAETRAEKEGSIAEKERRRKEV